MASKSILVLHGPNLNLLGSREPEHYGKLTLADIDQQLNTLANTEHIALESYQSNAEADIVGKIQSLAVNKVDFIIINPAAFTHTSVAIRDALAGVAIPFVEVHLSNIYARETFRQHSYFSDLAVGVISGLGADGYLFALDAAISRLNKSGTI